MIPRFQDWHPVLQALVATLGTWGVTALGAGLIPCRSVLRKDTTMEVTVMTKSGDSVQGRSEEQCLS